MRHDIEQIQETCRVFSIALKITGYERVVSPLTLPPVPAMTSNDVNADVEGEQNQETKGKGKEKETIPEEHSNIMTDYNPLVYLLPVIHFEGEFRGSDVDARAHRRARGTVRMIGDGAVRWTMVRFYYLFLIIFSLTHYRLCRYLAKLLHLNETSGPWRAYKLVVWARNSE